MNHLSVDIRATYGYSTKTSLQYLNEEYLKTGVSLADIYHMKISQLNKYDDKLYQSVKARLLANEKYVKDMGTLGNTLFKSIFLKPF